MKIEFFRDLENQWRVRFMFNNGNIFATTEGYKNKRDCCGSVRSVLTSAQMGNISVQFYDTDGGIPGIMSLETFFENY